METFKKWKHYSVINGTRVSVRLTGMSKNGSRHTLYQPAGSLLKRSIQINTAASDDSFSSDTEDTRQESLRHVQSDTQSILETPPANLDSDNEDYEKQADALIDEIWNIFQDNESWTEETKSEDELDVVTSKSFPKWGKIFRLSSTIAESRTDIVKILFDRQEDIPKWSATVNDCRVLEVINQDLYITYQLTNEQAQGFISKRDFVNLTTRRSVDDVIVLAAQACIYPKMAAIDKCVRATNGPTAYLVEKVTDTTSRFTWLLNVDLKGWIPQYLINSSLANVQLGLIESLRNYLVQSHLTEPSFSSK